MEAAGSHACAGGGAQPRFQGSGTAYASTAPVPLLGSTCSNVRQARWHFAVTVAEQVPKLAWVHPALADTVPPCHLLSWTLLLLQSHGVDVDSAKEAGMAEMSEVFKAVGAEVYLPADGQE